MTERRIPLTGPLDLGWTFRLMTLWGESTWIRWDGDGAWYARRTRQGPGTVCVQHRGDHLLATAWGDGGEVVLDEVPALVGLHDAGVAAVEPHHPVVADLKRRMPGLRAGRTGRVWSQLVSVALAQKVTGKESKAALRRLAWRHGERAPGPRDDLWLLPTPQQVLALPYYVFHPLGIERHRAELVRRIASRAAALQRAAGMPPAQGRVHLEQLRGIGPWTSGVVMGGAMGDPDAVPVGDYHLPDVVAYALAGEPRADDARMLELLEPYAGQRGRVVRMLKGAGITAPRFGPKSPVRDIRGW